MAIKRGDSQKHTQRVQRSGRWPGPGSQRLFENSSGFTSKVKIQVVFYTRRKFATVKIRVWRSLNRIIEPNQWIEPMNRISESNQWIESVNRINESNQWIGSVNRISESNQWIESMNRINEANQWIESMNRVNESNQWTHTIDTYNRHIVHYTHEVTF